MFFLLEPFKLIKENKTWADARYHCREEHMDLVSILDNETQVWVGLEAQKADTPFVWLGLQYICGFDFWIWVNDQCVFFNQWAPDKTRTAVCSISRLICQIPSARQHVITLPGGWCGDLTL